LRHGYRQYNSFARGIVSAMQYTQYLRWALIVGLFFIPFISLLVANGNLLPAMFFPYITGKNFAFRILVEVLLGLYILLALRDPKYRPRSSLIMWVALGFVAWMGIATALSIDPIKSFWSNFERMEGYVSLLHLFAFFVVAGAVLSAERLWERFLQTSVFASMLQGVVVLLQVLGWLGFAPSSQSGVRADGTFGNATYLAVFLLINFFITLYLLAGAYSKGRRIEPWLQVNYGLALVLQAAGIAFSQTRGAMLGLVAGLVVGALYLLWQARGPEWRTARRVSAGTLGALVLLGGLLFALRDTAAVQAIPGINRLASISFTETTVMSRFEYIWPIAVWGALERPVFGWGQENFSFVFNKNYDPGLYGQEEWFDRAHNQFLDWFIAGGGPAFVLYTLLYLLAAWAIFRSSTLRVHEQAALLGLLAAYGFNNMFVFDNIMSGVYFFTLLAFAHMHSRRELPGWLFLSRPLDDRAIAIVAPIIGIAVLVGAYQLNAPGIARAKTLIAALQPSQDLRVSFAAFERALEGGALGRQEAVEQMLRFASAVASNSNATPELRQEVFAATREAAEALIAERPDDARIELIYAGVLAQYGELPEAIKYLESALANAPRKQLVLFQTGLTLIQGGAADAALLYLKQAFDLEPRYDRARIMYATGLYYAGQEAQADALLEERFGTVLVEDDMLLQVYADTGRSARIVGIWELRVAANPDDPQTHVGLATAHFNSGNIEATIAELEIAAGLNPGLAPQIRTIIGQIRDGTLRPGQQ
jgi:tetratricopeptide (TPR) repeat protein